MYGFNPWGFPPQMNYPPFPFPTNSKGEPDYERAFRFIEKLKRKEEKRRLKEEEEKKKKDTKKPPEIRPGIIMAWLIVLGPFISFIQIAAALAMMQYISTTLHTIVK